MSKINDLIKEYCPNGVKYKKLYEVTIWDKKFNGTTKQMQPNIIKFNHISAKDLKELLRENGKIKLLSTGNFDGYTNINLVEKIVNESEVITIPSGGSANLKYYNGKFIDSGNLLAVSSSKEKYNLKYIWYFLKNINSDIQNMYRGSSVQHPDMLKILNIFVPVPPIIVQQEIVKILDKFTELEAEIEAELEAELEAREKQYQYYKKKLFDENNQDAIFMKISEIGKCYAGATPKTAIKEYWNNGEISWMSSGEVNSGQIFKTEKKITQLGYDKSSTKMIPKNTVVMALAGQGKTRGMVAITRIPLCTNQSLCSIVTNSKIDSEYLYYFLQSKYMDLRNISSGDGTRGGLNLKMIQNYTIPVPSIERQKHIVSILNKFDKIINDVNEGLPSEIKARKKQYEYYRNKLLTFKELSHE